MLSFIEGGTVMAAELCGARLLAPVFGSSLYVWASVMGITLLALAAGYFGGGYLSLQQSKQSKRLFAVLNLAALFILAMPLIAYYIVPRISYLSFLTGVVMSAAGLMFIPVFFLGASSPLFIAIQLGENGNPGRVSGTVYAVSTAGGILSTFLCGFWLIPQLGLYYCLGLFGLILFIANIFVFKVFKPIHFFVPAGLIYLMFGTLRVTSETIYYSDGMLGRIEVKQGRYGDADTFRYLTLNGTIQSEVFIKGTVRNKDYFYLLDTLIAPESGRGKALVLGLGGGLCSNMLVRKHFNVDAVDIDARMTLCAHKFFGLDSSVNCVTSDGRYYLNHLDKKYDLVLFDVFRAEEQPSHLITEQSLSSLKQHLLDSARIFINWHGFMSSENGFGTSILYNTLRRAGFYIKMCALPGPEESRNLVFIASLSPLGEYPFELNETPGLTTLVNTDERPLLEKYNAGANLKWRENYLRYYQQR